MKKQADIRTEDTVLDSGLDYGKNLIGLFQLRGFLGYLGVRRHCGLRIFHSLPR